MTLDRRDFLKAAGAAAAGAVGAGAVGTGAVAAGAVGAGAVGASAPPLVRRTRLPQGRLLDVAASDSPIDTVVVLMMENRSFDHYLGWMGTDERYLDGGRSRYGKDFRIAARNDLTYPDAAGRHRRTHHLGPSPVDPQPYRGCGHPIPGHGWFSGRIELAEGFLAAGTGNDEYTIGWFDDRDIPVHAHLAQRFTVCDHSFASVMAGTIPNRQYLYTAQSGGERFDPGPLFAGMFRTPTIFDKLVAGGVPFTTFYSDLPMLLLWGEQYADHVESLDDYFTRAAAGTLPNVVFVNPRFGGDLRTDDHSQGDIRVGQAFIGDVFDAFVSSRHWEHGLFVLTYDEWGGFFDHVSPPILPDERASPDLDLSFGLAGFRVPTILSSPYPRPGFVDHTVYDHTSILRFLEWRFLGAPPRGPGMDGDHWFLTARDRHANNLGEALAARDPHVAPELDVGELVVSPSAACDPEPLGLGTGTGAVEDPFQLRPDLEELLAARYPAAAHTPWYR